jgi:hypothetical protein
MIAVKAVNPVKGVLYYGFGEETIRKFLSLLSLGVFYTMDSAGGQYRDGFVVKDVKDSAYIIVRIALDRHDRVNAGTNCTSLRA